MRSWGRRLLRGGAGLGLFLLVLLAGCGLSSSGLPLVGLIIWDQEISAFAENVQGVIEGLREEGFQNGLNLRLEVVNARGDRAVAAQAARRLQGEGARLLLTVGTVPTLVALEVTRGSDLPLVYSLVGAPDATGLGWPKDPRGVRFTGTSMEVPVREQLRYFLMAKPTLSHLGILYCRVTPQAVATGEAAEREGRQLGLQVSKAEVPDDRWEVLEEAMAGLLSGNIEALFLPTDPVLISPKNLKLICELALRAYLPVLLPSGSSVTAGALLSYHADFAEVGRQAGRQAARLLAGTPVHEVPPQHPAVKRLTLNLKVAQALHLPVPRNLLSRAYYLYQ